jgi:hypothetical protein
MNRYSMHALAAACALLALPALAVASSGATADPAPEPAAAEQPEVAEAAVRIYVDPETGQRSSRPVAADRGKLNAAIARERAFSQSSEGLVEEPLPGGGSIMHLQGRFQSTYAVQRDADGKLVFACSDPSHAAMGAHAHTAAPAREDR